MRRNLFCACTLSNHFYHSISQCTSKNSFNKYEPYEQTCLCGITQDDRNLYMCE